MRRERRSSPSHDSLRRSLVNYVAFYYCRAGDWARGRHSRIIEDLCLRKTQPRKSNVYCEAIVCENVIFKMFWLALSEFFIRQLPFSSSFFTYQMRRMHQFLSLRTTTESSFLQSISQSSPQSKTKRN